MKREIVKSIVDDVVNEKLSNLIEEMSQSEFTEMICDMYHDQTGEVLEDDEMVEQVNEVIGEKVLPLLHKVMEYVSGIELPKLS
jgi:23S rRNA U2552 (ribose-2'-O)-methylase RlmE/FtsJ